MPGPGEYRPDPSEGITRVADLPKPKIRVRSRNYRRRPCPRLSALVALDLRGRPYVGLVRVLPELGLRAPLTQ